MPDHAERLTRFLESLSEPTELNALTADASTREYFRVAWQGSTAVACVYPEPADPQEITYLDVSQLFLANGLPVARVLDHDGSLGIIVLEDLGDRILRDEMMGDDVAKRSRLRNEAISLI